MRGAMPGIALPARPAVGLAYREEYSKNVAEDQSRILALDTLAIDISGGSDREELISYAH